VKLLIWPATSLKFVHLALRSKRLDTPELVEVAVWIQVLYNTCTLPIFLYHSECWAVTKTDVHKIDALDQWCLLGIKWYHHVRNDDVRRKTEQPHLSATVQAQRLSLFGHIAQMSDESDAKQILTASPLENWRRPPGRPCTTWMKTIQQDLESLHLSLNEGTDVAQNRPLWRMMSMFGATHS